MLSHTDLKKGSTVIINNQPCEILEAFPQRYAQRKLVVQTKFKNLITGSVVSKTVHQGEVFEEAEIAKIKVKFLYSHRDRFFFSEEANPAKRFDLSKEQIGESAQFLKANQEAEGVVFKEQIININTPIKVQLKVVEAPPGIKGDRAQGGTKIVTLESGAKINAPLFIKEGDVVEVNTESSEYARRV